MRSRFTLLLPREHGTYGELLFPLASALIQGHAGAIAWGIVCMAIGGFLAHEGFVVLTGLRGRRAQRENRRVASQSIAVFGALSLGGAGLAWFGAPPLVRWSLGLAVLLSCASIAIAWKGKEQTLAGELAAALALTSWSLPVALAAGLLTREAGTIWCLWLMAFAIVTVSVRTLATRRANTPARGIRALAIGVPIAVLLGAYALTTGDTLPSRAPIALMPVVLASLALGVAPVHPRHLREVGWAIVAVSVVMLGLIRWTLA